ncbi:hypothetical protein N431DRAFT_564501 [Stipitochalara longipes BDJ]|nr:hypothetical protein N431DRAFT_564501 [Stipitochalara longipes BDJ]
MMSNGLPAGSSSRTANGRASQGRLSSNTRKRRTQLSAPSPPSSGDSSAALQDLILPGDEIPDHLYRCDYFDIEDQPMLRGFTPADSTLDIPTTTRDLVKLVRNHLKQEQSSAKSTKLSPFISFSRSRHDVEKEIIHPHKSKNRRITYKGAGRSFRLYAVDGRKLELLKLLVINVQGVVELAGWEDDGVWKDEFLVWKGIPEITVVEEAHYDEIKAKRMIELQPLQSPGQQKSKGGNKGTVIIKGSMQKRSNGTDHSDATKKQGQKKPGKGRPPKPEEVRDELKDDEFRVAAIVNHWPQYRNRPTATWYLLRLEEGIGEDSWSKEVDVSNDLLEQYWERRGVENRDLGIAMRKAEKAATEEAAETGRAAEEEIAQEGAAMRRIAEKKIAAEMEKIRAARRM